MEAGASCPLRRGPLWSGPLHVVVEGDYRTRETLPGKAVQHRRGQAREIDFDDLLGAEELVKAAAEMAAGFDHDRTRPANIEVHHLEKDRVGALHPVRDDDNRDPAHSEGGAGPELEPQPGI